MRARVKYAMTLCCAVILALSALLIVNMPFPAPTSQKKYENFPVDDEFIQFFVDEGFTVEWANRSIQKYDWRKCGSLEEFMVNVRRINTSTILFYDMLGGFALGFIPVWGEAFMVLDYDNWALYTIYVEIIILPTVARASTSVN